MPANKTQPVATSVATFLDQIPAPALRADCFALVEMMQAVSKLPPVMWGTAIVGFGSRHYVYESGREGDTVLIGFAPRKANIAIYFYGGVSSVESELATLGKHKTGKGCLYINSLGDVKPTVLKKILSKAFQAGLSNGTQSEL